MDKKTFGQLILDNEEQLYRIAKSILKNDVDCEDAAQEAIVKGFCSLDQLKKDCFAKTWLIRILIHECYRIRKENLKKISLEEEKNKEEVTEDFSDLYQALLNLPTDLRVILVLYYMEGYTVREIAEIVGLPVGTVKSRMHRGRKMLKQLLEEV